MKPKIRFLHGADFHLAGLPENQTNPVNRCRAARFAAMDRFISLAIEHDVDFVLIAGDLFDAETDRRGATLARVIASLNRLQLPDRPAIPVFIIHGNHDPLALDRTGKTLWGVALAEHVTIFPANEPLLGEVRRSGKTVARIAGQSYSSRSERRSLHRRYPAVDRATFNIALLHTDLAGAGSCYCPATISELLACADYDYWALGHRHLPGLLNPAGAPVIAYSGMIQAGDAGEPGPHGALLVELEDGRTPVIRFLPTEIITWTGLRIDITPLAGRESNCDDVRNLAVAAATVLHENGLPDPLDPQGRIRSDHYLVNWTIDGRAEVHRDLEENMTPETLDEAIRAVLPADTIVSTSVELRSRWPRPSLEALIKGRSGEVYEALRRAAEKLRGDLERDEDGALLKELFGVKARWDPDLETINGDWSAAEAFELVGIARRDLDELIREALEETVDAVHSAALAAPKNSRIDATATEEAAS